ncbi:phage baseplate protein, partial [Herbiconiux daphne]
DVPLTSDFGDLSKVTEYMEFKRDSGNTYNIVEFSEPTLIKNAMVGKDGTDLASIDKVEALINEAILKRIYPVGSYFMSENSTNPATVLQAPNTVWLPIVGFLGGIGASSDGANGQVYQFRSGTGGRSSVALAPANMPLQSASASLTTSGSTASTSMRFTTGHADGNHHDDSGGILFNTQNGNHSSTLVGSATIPAQSVTGTISVGNATPTPVEIIPTYRGAYIWRRIT